MENEQNAVPAPAGAKPKAKRAPRAAKPAPMQVPLTLPKPTTSNGSANATLIGTVEKKFSRIVLRDKAGKDIVVVHSTKPDEKAKNPGSATVWFIYALIDAVLAGQGAGPDGSAIYAAEQWDAFVKYWGQHVKGHMLVCEPAGRSGAQGYIGTLDEFHQQAALKANLVRRSIKAFGVSRPHTRTAKSKVETIEVRL